MNAPDFDPITRTLAADLARKAPRWLGIAVLSLAVLLSIASGPAAAKPKAALCPCDTWNCGSYIGGGGTIDTADGTASFSVYALQVPYPTDEYEPADTGGVHWIATNLDGTVLTLTSVLVDDYGWDGDDIGGTRWVRGLMSVNGEGEVPFVMRLLDGGPPESGQDTVELVVGAEIEGSDGAGFGYRASGPLAHGDVQIQEVPLDVMAPA